MYFKYDKENNLVTISNSLVYYITGKKLNNTNQKLDQILNQKKYNKITVILFDGLGKSIKEKHLSKNDYLRKKDRIEITSIFPPTTVAATTAFLTGLYPCQNGWLGWQQYFKKQDAVVEMFTNFNVNKNEQIVGPFLSYSYCPYLSIIDIINNSNKSHAYTIYPKSISKTGPDNLNDFFKQLDQKMKQNNSHFIYAYWNEPDHLIHLYGTNHPLVKETIKNINKKIYFLGKSNPDNLIIVLADHSLVDSKFYYIFEHEDFKDCLSNVASLDSRSTFFHVKPEKKEDFIILFNKYYGKEFILKSKEEVINEKWFGEGDSHPLFKEFIGDFMATSISKYGFTNNINEVMIGAHADSLEEESKISIAIINQ